jgi:hypothetical protein
MLCSANEPNEVILRIINGLEAKNGLKSQNMDGPLLAYCGFGDLGRLEQAAGGKALPSFDWGDGGS